METIENLKQQKELPVIITDDQGIVIYVMARKQSKTYAKLPTMLF